MQELSSADYVEEDTLKDKYLLFSVDNEIFGIDLKYVIEIVGMHDITPVPKLPDYIKGIINLRGNIYPVMDIRMRFKNKPTEYTARTSVVILNYRDVCLGVIVDNAIEVATITSEEILPPPRKKDGYHNVFVKGISKSGKNKRLLIDFEKLIDEEEISKTKEKK
ncbi:MAG: Chemotaxis protein CheW [Firmicutes bacterium ADurb.Bin193]|nr:MAG: Chemotaxis protein CheW [Firmicutes bacterium ADurb.Bin193]